MAWHSTGRAALVALALLAMALPALAEDAEVTVYAFLDEERAPLSEAQVTIGDVTITTDFSGVGTLTVPAGRVQAVLAQERIIPEGIAAETELAPGKNNLFLTLLRNRRPQLLAEAAQPAVPRPPLGKVTGVITNDSTGGPFPGVRVVSPTVQAVTGTNGEGRFTMSLPAGEQRLFFIFPLFGTRVIDGIQVVQGETTEIAVLMEPAESEAGGAEVVVEQELGTVQSLLNDRRESASITDSLGAEAIADAGDGDTASALQRVTGVTVVDGKYVYVRGMGERYSSVTLNGSTLPSPDPARRVVPLDLFPTDMVESIVVQKSYSADQPGEFGGGSISIELQDIPERFFWQVSGSTSYLSDTTFEDGLTYDGGGTDWLGIDDGIREMPGDVRAASDQGRVENFPAAERERLGELFENEWTPTEESIGPSVGFGTSVGGPFEILGNSAGASFGLYYDQDWDTSESIFRVYRVVSGGELQSRVNYEDYLQTSREVSLGSLFNFGYDFAENQRLRFGVTVVRNTEDLSRIYSGINEDVDDQDPVRFYELRWIESMIWTNQIAGTHLFPGANYLSLDWRYTYGYATRDEPDRRTIRYDFDGGDGRFLYSDDVFSSQRFYSELEDNNHDGSVDLTLPLRIRGELNSLIQFGGGQIIRDREVDVRRFGFNNDGDLTTTRAPDVRALAPEELIVPDNIRDDGLDLQEVTLGTDNYEAEMALSAAYVQSEIAVADDWTLTGGVRTEFFDQEVRNLERFNPIPLEATLDHVAVLPNLGVVWRFREAMQFRAAYGRSVNRPDFREMSQSIYNEVVGGREIVGNPDLEVAVIDNFDLRWEWYPRDGELFSIGAFYKQFTDPIEFIVLPSAQEALSYRNVDSAYNVGAEFEVRRNLDIVGESLRHLFVSANLALIYSRVDVGESGLQTSDERPLQGQSPFTLNLMVGYDNPDIGTQINLVYNVFGERIAEVGGNNRPDTYEEPYHQLDLVVRQTLTPDLRLSFKASNLLGEDSEFTQDDLISQFHEDGTEVSLGLSWSIF